jgi:thiol-disulfide isomerase/thioredoxin
MPQASVGTSSNPARSSQVVRISAVIAKWCPHCYPLSVDNAKKMAEDLGVQIRVLDIDREDDMKVADELVKKYGDDAEDYLIPQVFMEFKDGTVKHVFTGFSENPEVTKKRWEDLFKSRFYIETKQKMADVSG